MNRPIDMGGASNAAREFKAPDKGRRIARRGTLVLAAAAVAAGAIACASGEGGSQSPGITRIATGEIHPANRPNFCLSAEPQPNGMPAKVGSGIEVRPCGGENPNEIWNIHQEADSSGEFLVIRLGQTDLALSAQNPPHLDEEAVHARLGIFNSGNNPFIQFPYEAQGPFFVINEGGQSRRVLTVPTRPSRHRPYDHALWTDEATALEKGSTEETIFKFPPFTTIGVAVGVSPSHQP